LFVKIRLSSNFAAEIKFLRGFSVVFSYLLTQPTLRFDALSVASPPCIMMLSLYFRKLSIFPFDLIVCLTV
jgi:hypothetical protein